MFLHLLSGIFAAAGISAAVAADHRNPRPLAGTGWSIEIPKRLDGPGVEEAHDGSMRFLFSRGYPWYRFDAMGSSTVMREALAVVLGKTPAQRTWAEESVVHHVQPGAGSGTKLAWRSAGRMRVGEGVYTANGLKDAVVLAVLDVPERGAQIAYRGWRKDVSPQQAQALVTRAAESLGVEPRR
jgi:hypothetical protein